MADRNAETFGYFDAPQVGRFTPVERRGTGAVESEACRAAEGACSSLQKALKKWRPADVAFAEDKSMNDGISSRHRRILRTGVTAGALFLAAGCASVQSYSFQRADAPDRLPELAYDEVRKGAYADHHSLLGPVQVEIGPQEIAEFPVILERGKCYRALAVEEARRDPLEMAFLNEGFLVQDKMEGLRGMVTMARCQERDENLLLSIEGTTKRVRLVVGLLLLP